MDATLDETADSLLNQRLPDNWRKLAPETCMQLAAWLNHLQVNRAIEVHIYTYSITSHIVHTYLPNIHLHSIPFLAIPRIRDHGR